MPRDYTLLLLGDIVLARLIDQLLPTHISATSAPDDAAHAAHFKQRLPHLKDYSYASPWGNNLALLKSTDLILGNLETSLTTHDVPWPDKVFNYRSHPENVRCLLEAGFGGGRGYVSLANNHTLDFGVEGLRETVRTLKESGVAFAGAGETGDEAGRPVTLLLGGRDGNAANAGGGGGRREVRCWSFSDHPQDWDMEEFNLIDYSERSRRKMKGAITKQGGETPALKVVSVHWGPNYAWQPAQKIRDLAHCLVDECDVDIIHGHSSHHIQGVEVYKGKLVVYGCGDFVDDYAVVSGGWRNDLSAAWKVTVRDSDQGPTSGEAASTRPHEKRLEVVKLEVFPNRIKHFQAGLLDKEDKDHEWVRRKFTNLCKEMGTKVQEELGSEGQIVINIGAQPGARQ